LWNTGDLENWLPDNMARIKTSAILGLNARSTEYSYAFNSSKAKKAASSKLKTKNVLKNTEVITPETYAIFRNSEDIIKFDWGSLPASFALKPNKGLGGEGIIVVKKRAKDPNNSKTEDKYSWLTTSRKKITVDDLKLHIQDILEGAYSLGNQPDRAYIEEFVGRHKAFKKYAYRGTPDLRIIVFNKVPVMAMMRLPTKESGGRANLHQGAIAVGIDIATGITTRAYWKGDYLIYKPGTKRKLHGIKIPQWNKVLKTAVECSIATGLNYLGADVVLHPKKGPMIFELNYQPGLGIQLANKAGLRKRLERVDDLEVRDSEHGVKIAKALFASNFADRVKADEGLRTISSFEEIKIKGFGAKKGMRKKAIAKIDTGAWRTSISQKLADDLGLLEDRNVLWSKKVKSSLGEEHRPVINLVFWLGGRKIISPASVSKRGSLKFPVIIGRKNLKGFLVEASVTASEKRDKVQRSEELVNR